MRAPIRRPNLRRIRAELDVAAVRTWDDAHLKGGPGGVVFAGAPGSLPAGRRVYAVGDVHGDLVKLRAMHAAIAADLAARPVSAILRSTSARAGESGGRSANKPRQIATALPVSPACPAASPR